MAVTAPCGGGRGGANAWGVGSGVDAVDAHSIVVFGDNSGSIRHNLENPRTWRRPQRPQRPRDREIAAAPIVFA